MIMFFNEHLQTYETYVDDPYRAMGGMANVVGASPAVPDLLRSSCHAGWTDSRPLRSVRDGLFITSAARLWLSVAVALVLVGGMTAAAVLTFGGRESGAQQQHPQVVGSATTFDSASSATATTTLPTGTASGDVVVSVIDTSPIVAVTCPQGSSQEFDTVTASTTFVACMNVVSGSPTSATANLRPAGTVSMVTMAFSGVNDSEPVRSLKSGGDVSSPATITKRPTSC